MNTRDEERLELAEDVLRRFARPEQLTPLQARAFVKCLQQTWQVEQISWDERDSDALLTNGWRILHAAMMVEEIEDDLSDEAQQLFQRAGELFEWLARSGDTKQDQALLMLLSAGSYQLSGLPAMATSLLRSAEFEHAGEKLFAAFLQGDFDRVLAIATDFWMLHGAEPSSLAALTSDEGEDLLSWRYTVETVRALGLFAYTLRRGLWERNDVSISKIKALAQHGNRVLPSSLSSLMTIFALVADRYSGNSMYRPLLAIAGENAANRRRASLYVRRQYRRNRGTLWAPQRRGLERLQQSSSFALCTPTGSGKTLVANIALLKELLLENSDTFVEPLALYIVPSRALANEVETKLAGEIGQDIIVTGLYGGNDWGMTDYWLDSDKPAVLIVTVEKAEALFRNLGSLLLSRLKLLILDEAHQVVLDTPDQSPKRFARHTDRSLRLESFVTRLLAQKPELSRIALTAVAGGAAEPVAKWIESSRDAEALGGNFRSTRQVIGMLETSRNSNPRLRLDLVNGIDIEVRGRDGDSPYINLQFGPMPDLPNQTYSSMDRVNQLTVLWTALNLVHSDQRVLISIAQSPEQTMRWFCEALQHETWEEVSAFTPPRAATARKIYTEALSVCSDYCGEDSFEYRLLLSGIATSHGQMPQKLRRIMNRLIERGICPVTVATATLTEGVNLPFDIIFVPNLKRPFYDPVEKQRQLQPMSAAEFLNLSGRAGRPGASRHGEGMTFVAVPVANAATAAGLQATQTRQRRDLLREYNTLKRELSDPAELSDTATPLSQLINVLFQKAKAHLGIADEDTFLEWLERVSPLDVSKLAGNESDDDRAMVADTLDELDSILLAATEEASTLDEKLAAAAIERALARLWSMSFSALAIDQEAWMEAAFIKRGVTLVTEIYPDPDLRRRLYSYGLPPNVGLKFEAVGEKIIEILKTQTEYGSASIEQRMELFAEIGTLMMDNSGFGFSVRATQADEAILENWMDVLSWWFAIDGAIGPEPEKLRTWQRFVSDNLEFRLGVAIGASVSKAWNDGTDDPLQVPTLDSWKGVTGLPWIAFWARELIRWGTHEPFVAFAMSQGIATTRDEAFAEKANFETWLEGLDGFDKANVEARIDPQKFMEWKKSERDVVKEKRQTFEHSVEPNGDLKQNKYQVVPLSHKDRVEWIDPAGFTLAQTVGDMATLPSVNIQSDYVLNLKAKDGPQVKALFRVN